MNSIDKFTKTILKSQQDKGTKPYDTTAEVVRVEGGTAYVHVAGGVAETPATMCIDVKKGDKVRVNVAGGKAYVMGNATSPPTDDSLAKKAQENALKAAKAANEAVTQAETAHEAAKSAQADANTAHIAADAAVKDARTANESANAAIEDAATARTMAEQAEADADTAREAAEDAVDYANDALDSSNKARQYASDANDSAQSALTASQDANTYAQSALASAESASHDASEAQKMSNKAYYHLSEIEDIVGAVNWIAEHGQYDLTSDTEVINGKWYFKLVDGSYVVDTPVSNPHDEGFYELTSVDEAVSNYLATHLAVTDTGLYVQMAKDGGAKIQITGTGIYLLDANGDIVAEYTSSVMLGDKSGVHITLSPSNGLGFYQGAEDDTDPSVNRVAYISGNKLYIKSAEITNELRIGHYLWKIRNDGARISLRYSPNGGN